ncbi:Hypothetical Protein FCC1311_074602, partial [Hondaea fermentalgiana]
RTDAERRIRAGIHRAVCAVFEALRCQADKRDFFPMLNAFEVFGFDFIVREDEGFSLQLLEVNHGPALEGHTSMRSSETAWKDSVCFRTVRDVLRVILGDILRPSQLASADHHRGAGSDKNDESDENGAPLSTAFDEVYCAPDARFLSASMAARLSSSPRSAAASRSHAVLAAPRRESGSGSGCVLEAPRVACLAQRQIGIETMDIVASVVAPHIRATAKDWIVDALKPSETQYYSSASSRSGSGSGSDLSPTSPLSSWSSDSSASTPLMSPRSSPASPASKSPTRAQRRARARRNGMSANSSPLGTTLQWLQETCQQGLEAFFTSQDQLTTANLPLPTRSERWAVAKQRRFHSCQNEPDHIRELYDELPTLRKRVVHEAAILNDFIKRGTATVLGLEEYAAHRSISRTLRGAISSLRRYVRTCAEISFFNRALEVIDSLESDRKALQYMRLAWDRRLRKSHQSQESFSHFRRGHLDESRLSEKSRLELQGLLLEYQRLRDSHQKVYACLNLLHSRLHSVHVSLIKSATVEFQLLQAFKDHLFIHPSKQGEKLYQANLRTFYQSMATLYPL